MDGDNYAYRVFYALPALSNAKGQATQAVYGFAVFLLKLLREHPGDAVVVTFDAPGRTFRDEAFAAYKAQRKPMPDDLRSQLPLLDALVAAFGIPRLQVPGVEADDVLATLAERARGAGQGAVIYSGDKDVMQLVDDAVRVVIPRHEDAPLDAAGVRTRWGVPPERIPDLLALMGDASDNLPGVPGVGEKTAAALLTQFGSLDAMFADLAKVKSPVLRGKLSAAEPQVRATRGLAVLRRDVPLPEEAGVFAPPRPDGAALRALFAELEFSRLAASLPGGAEVESAAGGVAAPPAGGRVRILHTLDAHAREALARAPRLLCAALGDGVVVDAGGDRVLVRPGDPALRETADALNRPGRPVVALASKPVARALLAGGVRLEGVAMDAGLAAGLLRARAGRDGPAELCREVLGWAPDFEGAGEDEAARGGLMLDALAALAPVLEERVRASGQWDLLREVELPVAPVLAAMEARGITLDRERLAHVSAELRERLVALESTIVREAGIAFNPLSPKQVAEVLFKKLNLPAKRRTKTGYSTDEEVLEELAALHPVPAALLEFRKLAKLLGTYLEPLPGFCDARGILRTTYHQLGAATGRISSSDPNLQNIPVRGETGQRIREAFVPRDPGLRLLSADYSQIELRLLADVSGDAALLQAFRSGIDVHAATAAEMFGRAPADVSPDERRAAKAVNFGIVYGMTAYGLARQLRVPADTAKRHLERYFEQHPGVRAYGETTLAAARAQGWVATPRGRRRALADLGAAGGPRRQEAEREALNHPIQGAAADLLKLAMAAVAREVPDAALLLTIHDELLFEVPRERAGELAARVKAVMEGVGRGAVPLMVDAAAGVSWAACHH